MSLRLRIQLTLTGMTAGLVLLIGLYAVLNIRQKLKTDLGFDLLRTAETIAVFINGDAHSKVRTAADVNTPEFRELKEKLLRARRRLNLSENHIYTLRKVSEDKFAFVVMTHPKPFVGDDFPVNATSRYAVKRIMNDKEGRGVFTDVYETPNGTWISAFAPIHARDGSIDGFLEVDASYADFQSKYFKAILPLVIAGLLIPVLLIFASIFLSHRISRPLMVIHERMREMHDGRGDLRRKMDISGSDEIAATGRLVDGFIGNIAETIRDVKTFSGRVRESSARIQEHVQGLRTRGQEQSALVQTTSAANEELSAAIREISSITGRQEKLIMNAGPLLSRLLEFVIRVEQSSGEVNASLGAARERVAQGREGMRAMARDIEEINRSSEQISSIVEIIQDISDRVALLSLNASIEAARAGEYGRGFAVVAEEVTRLSDSTARQIKDISEIVEKNRLQTDEAVRRMQLSEKLYEEVASAIEGAVVLSDAGRESAVEHQAPARDGLHAVENITDLMRSVATAMQEQTRVSDEVAGSMSSLSELAEKLFQVTEEVHANLSELDRLTEQLEGNLGKLIV